jgi:hypothetical protein
LAGFPLAGSARLHAATISGTVKDPSGAVIAQARIEVRGGDLAQPVVFFSDGLGRSSPILARAWFVSAKWKSRAIPATQAMSCFPANRKRLP